MIDLNELYGMKTKYANERLFIDAKIAVVDEMIEAEKAKVVEPIEESCDEAVVE